MGWSCKLKVEKRGRSPASLKGLARVPPLTASAKHQVMDGRIDTAVSRVEGITFEVDFSVKGY